MHRKLFFAAQILALLLFTSAIGVAAAATPPGTISSANATQDFEDVPTSNPFAGYLHSIYDADIVSGYNCGAAPAGACVGPNNLPYYLLGNSVTRGQMSKFVDLARTRPGIAISTTNTLTTSHDLRPISSRTDVQAGVAIYGATTAISSTQPAILGETASDGAPFLFGSRIGGVGVQGIVSNTNPGVFSAGVFGLNRGITGSGVGVYGSQAGTGYGVYGTVTGAGRGVYGNAGDNGIGVYGSATTGGIGAEGESPSGIGVYGLHSNAGFGGGTSPGVMGETRATFGGVGVYGRAPGVSYAVFGQSGSGFGVYGVISDTSGVGFGVYGKATGASQQAGYFEGKVTVAGNLDVTGSVSKGGGSFKIDDPIDPANKYLYHSFVESPDMMNIYNGVVTTDANGNATVTMQAWFQPLNRDFRYQLTPIGQFAQAIISSEVSGNKFSIKTDKPNVKVSWQVTGIRQDPWANANRIPTEQVKASDQKGKYLYPELYGQPASSGIYQPSTAPAPVGALPQTPEQQVPTDTQK